MSLLDNQSKEMFEQEDLLKRKDDRIEELESMLKANDPAENMENNHLMD